MAVDNVLHEESAQSARQQLTRERDRLQVALDILEARVEQDARVYVADAQARPPAPGARWRPRRPLTEARGSSGHDPDP